MRAIRNLDGVMRVIAYTPGMAHVSVGCSQVRYAVVADVLGDTTKE